MKNKLEIITQQKSKEVAALSARMQETPTHPIVKILQGEAVNTREPRFNNVLRGNHLSVIAEIKRKSPSKGLLAEITDPVRLANAYAAGGATALSILTDETFFSGHLTDLRQVALAVPALPILRKDFILDPIQIAEAVYAGADAILCIVAVLGQQTKKMLAHAKRMKIDVLVEVHSLHELDIALDAGADCIGVNNRNLTTLQVDPEYALTLIDAIPKHIVRVAESGIYVPELAHRYYQVGYDAVLIGEALVTANDPSHFIRACRHE